MPGCLKYDAVPRPPLSPEPCPGWATVELSTDRFPMSLPSVPPAEHFNRVWPSGLPGLEAWTSRWSVEPTRPHAHEEWQVSLTRSGHGTVRRRGGVETCGPGSLVLLAPGEVHTLAPADSPEVPWVFDTLFLSAAGPDREGTPQRIPRGIEPRASQPREVSAVASHFAALHRCVVEQTEPLDRETALHDFLATLRSDAGEAAHESAAPEASLRRVRDYLEAHATRAVTLSELATVAGIGEFQLVRSFRREFGLPPYAYHLQVRINRARRLLRRGLPVAEVALETGFADQAHLTRHFRNLVGLTPGVYRAGRSPKASSVPST